MGKLGGARPGAGRPKGAPNKITRNIKAAIEGAFDRAGGEDYLLRIARDDPKTFCALLSRILPTQLAGESGGPIEFVTRISKILSADGS